jgi:cytochrome c-type biogenesis protein CcmH
VLNGLFVLLIGAVLSAGAGFWALRAYRRAGGDAPRAALAACALTALAALGAYLAVGKPSLPGAPYAERLSALLDRDPRSYSSEERVAVLSHFAKQHPDDFEPHFFSGQELLAQGRAREAAAAFEAALRRDPISGEALLGLGRALVSIEGRVTPEAQAVFLQAGERSADPAPWIYLAMAAMEQSDAEAARAHWRQALSRMPPDDPRRAMVLQQIGG